MDLLEELKENGCDTQDGLNRLMGNKAIYEKLLKKAPASIEPLNVQQCLDSGDITKSIEASHTVKGITGNLSLTPLYTAYSKITDLLRADNLEEARQLYKNTLPLQDKIFSIIAKYSA